MEIHTHAHSPCINFTLVMPCRDKALIFFLTKMPLFHIEIFNKMDINPWNGWSNKIILGLVDVSFVPL